MAAKALLLWQTDRLDRLAEIEAHCVDVSASVPPNLQFLEETLRGYVLHLSAHFQGYCKDLYTECSQAIVGSLPPGFQVTLQAQFEANLQLERGNPNYQNIRADFGRFGIRVELETQDPAAHTWLADLSRLNDWRNKAAHQGTRVLAPATLSLPFVHGWKNACNRLATLLEQRMQSELTRIMGVPPW